VDRFLAISGFVAKRIERYYGREAIVVYPPVQRKGISKAEIPREDFVLCLGRLVPYKRVDLAIEACRWLGVRLVVAGDGPERGRLERMAGPNVEFLGEVSEDVAGRLLSTCKVFVFCGEEDFGIAPLEANAHGAPVVALRAGATVETMVEGKTAIFFDEPTGTALAASVKSALARSWDDAALRENAQRFTQARFRAEFGKAVIGAVNGTQA
jgi:glycosyltransferase involved in cell wall biosynthesis